MAMGVAGVPGGEGHSLTQVCQAVDGYAPNFVYQQVNGSIPIPSVVISPSASGSYNNSAVAESVTASTNHNLQAINKEIHETTS